MRDLNFNHLRYFWAVAHQGSLTRAAQLMNLSQSALSVQIQKLEHQMGHPLFERAGRKLALTEAGRIALDYADTVFKAGEELMSTLRGRPASSRQVLRVGALTTLSRNFQIEFLRPLVGRDDVELIVRSVPIRLTPTPTRSRICGPASTAFDVRAGCKADGRHGCSRPRQLGLPRVASGVPASFPGRRGLCCLSGEVALG